ncbi:MAG: 16S rRNA (cytidine(1402)-2'-O)-methyltransferase [Oscillospiraceae bacterium]
MGKLFVVGTPIGNLSDFSARAIQTLRDVDFIAAEDTRVSVKLLNHFEIKKPMFSYHAHNIREKGDQIVKRIALGESCAIITDAGMPCISDPGEDLVRICKLNQIEVVVVPGPSAVISALALSGLSTTRFCFEGFLSVRKNNRMEHLNSLINETRTIIFYEAPHKLIATLTDILQILGNRNIALARELTKRYEEVIHTNVSQALELYETKSPRGEFVIVIEGISKKEEKTITLEEAGAMVIALKEQGLSTSNAAKEISAKTGFKKGDLYKFAL